MKTNAQVNRNIKISEKRKVISILLLIIAFLNYYSLAQTGQIVVKIEQSKPEPKLEKLIDENKFKMKSAGYESNTTDESRSLINYRQLFPSSNRHELRKYYVLEFGNRSEMLKSINEIFPDKISTLEEYFEPQPLYVPNDCGFTFKCCEDSCRDIKLSYLDLINVHGAWEITKGNSDIVIGIHDSYLFLGHEDLIDKVFKVYDKNIRSQYSEKPDHCTMVAGIIAANTDNHVGISSVAYNCRIAKTSSNKDDLLKMAKDGIKVINISQDWGPYNPVDQELINELVNDYHITIVAAAGNKNETTYVYPASYDSVISVTSVGHEFECGTNVKGKKVNWKDCHKKYMNPGLAGSTHQHNDKVDICAPGYNILTLCHPETYKSGLGKPLNQLYSIESGSSFAAAIVSGVCGLIYSVNPDLTPGEVEKIIKSTAADIESIPENAEFKGLLGAGRIDAYKAVRLAAEMKGYSITNSDSEIIIQNNITSAMSSADSQAIKFYPNPANDKIIVNGAAYNDKLLIFSSTGKLLKEKVMQSNHEVVSIQELTSGFYIISVSRNNKAISREKIVKL